jgi:acyl-CoA dehydrogenase
MWEFETDPEFQVQLDWMAAFVRDEIVPLDALYGARALAPLDDEMRARVRPLQDRVRARGLWACHLGPELGGQGYGQVKFALMNEILGRAPGMSWGPVVFGCQAPDTGNAEIIAAYGTEAQKLRYLRPLLDGEMLSCFSMTEPGGGSDPGMFTCRAWPDGDGWVIDGEKFFSSNLRSASVILVMAVTEPDAPPHSRLSMFLVPADAPGIEVIRDIGAMWEPVGEGIHPHVRYRRVRVDRDALLGPPGAGFEVAQRRLGGGRIHHAMRTVGLLNRAFEMMCERVLSRETRGQPLAAMQLVQADIARTFVQIEQFRLLVLYTAWLVDRSSTAEARTHIAACKVEAARVLPDVIGRAMHLHGALGMSNLLPLGQMWAMAAMMGVMDGPSEVHEMTIAKQVLREHRPASGPWPSEFIPDRIEAARRQSG